MIYVAPACFWQGPIVELNMQKEPAVYILANKKNGTLYIGVTSNLRQRIYQHKKMFVDSFTHEHNIHMLVYYEACDTMEAALLREKQLKRWKRAWKIRLITKTNPEWHDLYSEILWSGPLPEARRGDGDN